jgi:ribosomal protein S21
MAVIRHNPKKANVSVRVRKDETVERAIKRFIKKCKKEGIQQAIRDRRYFKKPSQIRHEKANKRLRDIDKDNKKRVEKEKKMENYKGRPRKHNNNGPNRNNRGPNRNDRGPNRNDRGPNRNNRGPSRNNSNKPRPQLKRYDREKTLNEERDNQKKPVINPDSPFAKIKLKK